MKKREIFKVEGDKIVRLRRSCPKCGDGVFLAEHKDRLSCGACGYTEFKSKTPVKPVETSKEEKPVENIEKQQPEEPVQSEKPKEEKE